MTIFLEMYHPDIPATATDPVLVALQAVDDRAAKGWLLFDPDAVLPDPVTPYYTKEALLSQITGGAAPIGTALRSAFVPAGADADPGLSLGPHLLALRRGTEPDWDTGGVESLFPFWDHTSGRWAGVYTGYGLTEPDDALRSSVGLAFSDDLTTWTKTGTPVFTSTRNPGDPDENGVTGPVVIHEDGVWHLFHIGLTASGYEGGEKTICLATTTDDPSDWTPASWTRRGVKIAAAGTGWRAEAVWHCSVAKRGATYHIFFNATGNDHVERIGYATASSLLGPWTVDDVNSPLISPSTSGWDSFMVGDPSVYRVKDGWIAHYFGVDLAAGEAYDGLATTTDDDFPLGWVKHPSNPILSPGVSGSFDDKYAHKPVIVQSGGRAHHFYTAVDADDVRQIGLAISKPATVPVAISGSDTAALVQDLLAALNAQGLIAYTAGGAALVADSFNRADTTSALGAADSGQVWAEDAGTWGISGNQAYSVSAGGMARVDAGAVMGEVSVTVTGTMPAPGQAAGLVMRFQSAAVHYELDIQGGGAIELVEFNFGAAAVANNAAAGFVAGDRLTVLDDGTSLTVKRNDTTVLTFATTVAADATVAGIKVYSTAAVRFENFEVRGR